MCAKRLVSDTRKEHYQLDGLHQKLIRQADGKASIEVCVQSFSKYQIVIVMKMVVIIHINGVSITLLFIGLDNIYWR
ncbi:hypothetical protein BBM86_05865 [Vibrio parahaemolyticus]|nr:hypothetical protein BBN03_12865 [Vibrio parahaemolyticus]OEB84843.1 hypothetical protein BBM86_05865 [Vibrio parahaemolyticus]